MKKRPVLWAELIFAVLCVYAMVIGATMNAGMLNPHVQAANLLLIGVIGLPWLWLRTQRRWKLHLSAMDGAVLMSVLAIVLSLLANLDLWRRIAIGMWYAGLYVLVWYLLHDLIHNRVLRRQALWDALLLAGGVMIILSLREQFTMLREYFSLSAEVRQGLPPFGDLIRLEATTNNPNRLATIMIGLLPLALARTGGARSRLARLWWGMYALLAAEITLFTFSRAGWLSAAAGIGVFVVLSVAQSNLLSPARIRAWWDQNGGIHRSRLILGGIGASVILIAGMVFAGLIAVRVSSSSVRASDQRGVMYQTALNLFGEKPITGYGLFTFGRGQIRYDSMPPRQVHSHAHSLPLTIAAELGIVGLGALLVTALLTLRAGWQNWRATKDPHLRWMLIGGASALAGMGVHHLFDLTALTAAIALMGMVLAVSVTAPAVPRPVSSGVIRRLMPLSWAGLLLALLITGYVSNRANSHYFAALEKGFAEGDPAVVLGELDQAIQLDPRMPVYYLVKGFVAAEAALDPDLDSTQSADQLNIAIEAYQSFTEMEPFFAPAWANLGALYGRVGEPDRALEALERAVEIAPDSWEMVFNYGALLEQAGQTEHAREAYRQALQMRPDCALSSFWAKTPLRREVLSANFPDTTPSDKVNSALGALLALKQGEIKTALSRWAQAPSEMTDNIQGRVVTIVLTITEGRTDPQILDDLLEKLKAQQATPLNKVRYEEWLNLGLAYVNWAKGDLVGARSAVEKVKNLIPPTAPDLPEIISSQFIRLGVGRFLISALEAPWWTSDLDYLVSRLAAELP